MLRRGQKNEVTRARSLLTKEKKKKKKRVAGPLEVGGR
jgi:hypothetical protein